MKKWTMDALSAVCAVLDVIPQECISDSKLLCVV